jgi:hypothetical protein
MYFGTVELNPSVIAAALGDSKENVERVLEYLCAPDPKSRSKIEEGRRLVREGEYLYRVPTGNLYRGMRDEHDRRAYNRKKKAESRRNQQSNGQTVSTCESNNVSRRQPPSAHNREQITDNREQKEPTSNSEGSREGDDDCEKAVRDIAALYPKIRDVQNLSQEVQYAIAEAVARDGRDLVWMGTKSMAEAVACWPKSELKFIPAAGRFFRESQYKADPAEWDRRGNGNAANPVNRDRAPSKQVERAFGNLAAVATVFGGGDRPTAPVGGAGVEHLCDHAGPGQAARHGAAPAEVLGGKTNKRPG